MDGFCSEDSFQSVIKKKKTSSLDACNLALPSSQCLGGRLVVAALCDYPVFIIAVPHHFSSDCHMHVVAYQ